MALNEQELHALAHLRLDRAVTQVYLDLNNEIIDAPVGTTLDSTERFNPLTHPELHAGIGGCFDIEMGLVGVVMEKISETQIRVTGTLDGASSVVLGIGGSREDLLEMIDDQDMQLTVFALMAGLDAEEVR